MSVSPIFLSGPENETKNNGLENFPLFINDSCYF